MEAKWKDYRSLGPEVQLKLSASYLQHLAACQALSSAAKVGWELTALHQRIPKPGTIDTLRRRLYGEVPADFDNIIAWARTVGDVTVLPGRLTSSGHFHPSIEKGAGPDCRPPHVGDDSLREKLSWVSTRLIPHPRSGTDGDLESLPTHDERQ